MKNRTENISVRYRPQHLTKSHNYKGTYHRYVPLFFYKISENSEKAELLEII